MKLQHQESIVHMKLQHQESIVQKKLQYQESIVHMKLHHQESIVHMKLQHQESIVQKESIKCLNAKEGSIILILESMDDSLFGEDFQEKVESVMTTVEEIGGQDTKFHHDPKKDLTENEKNKIKE